MNKTLPILRKNRKSIETLIPNFGNSLKYIFPFSEFRKIENLKGSPIRTSYELHLKLHIHTRAGHSGTKSDKCVRSPSPEPIFLLSAVLFRALLRISNWSLYVVRSPIL